MSEYSNSATFTNEQSPKLNGSILDITSIHFTNQIILQIRLNGEMDSTYEVTKRGINSLESNISRPIAGLSQIPPESESLDEDNDDDFTYDSSIIRDNLADFQVVTRLGDTMDHKMPVICTQIGELYQSVIIPHLLTNGHNRNEVSDGTNFLITISSKIFRDKIENNDMDFGKLVLLLKTIKEMYM